MNAYRRTISVPNVDIDGCDSSYSTKVDYTEAVRLGAAKIGAVKVGRNYYYRADEVDEIFRLTPMEVAQLGAGELDKRGADYSLWSSTTGHLVSRPRRKILAAIA